VPPADPAARRTLRQGRYTLLTQLGSGSQGTTWDAVDQREGRAVAIKQFEIRGAKAWKDVELAEREARVLSSLSHPKLPAYVEHFEEDGVLYLVMEKIEGTPLSALRKSGAMNERDVERLLRDADDVLVYLHGRAPAVIHRDLKPSNVIRRPDGSFAFVDFGAVRDRMRPEGGSTVVGTFGYMAPEQFQGRAGPGSDVYAMGATALSMLTGEEPENLPHRGLGIDVGAALRGRTSGKLASALTRMLEIDPDARATRILPLLGGAASRPRNDRSATGREWRDVGERIRAEVERNVERKLERATRHARRAEEKARRRAERHTVRHHGPPGPRRPWRAPWFIILAFTVALVVAQLAVTLALRVAVPIMLVLLSIVFGAGLRRAARNVAGAGKEAGDAIRRARDVVGGDGRGDDGVRVDSVDERVRVREEEDEHRARVANEDEDDESVDDEKVNRRRGA
jgi:Protein kinase domain